LSESEHYKVALEVYNGPMDLLLFLIRREEIDIYDIPIARITEQYIQYVELLRHVDPDIISEFLVLAATLMEIKSRELLPTPPPDEADEEMIDPRAELIRQLLAYKTFKDAARSLEQASQIQSQKHRRSPVLPEVPAGEVELDSVDIWDLFDAFNDLLKQIGKKDTVHKVDVDDTPVALHIDDILDSLERSGGNQPFQEIFSGRNKGEMIGLFLALLELIRRRQVLAVQDRPFGTIVLRILAVTPDEPDQTIDRMIPSENSEAVDETR